MSTNPEHTNAQWFKSSYSAANTQCVEAAFAADRRLVRDSKLGDESPVLAFDPSQWRAFTARLRSGDLG
ncbi:DUF397 domain-containing protein [Saccharopolyspora griseoalba]|uniref:DUF397 domain-containing protein n=1 Tax=Saccharopolyspora griseoalba TaxID=1431848 RepID=A0ABW2LQK5_9PSEU